MSFSIDKYGEVNAWGINKNNILALQWFQCVSIHANSVTHFHQIAYIGFAFIYKYNSSFNKTIGFAPGTKTTFTNKFIDTHGVLMVVAKVIFYDTL